MILNQNLKIIIPDRDASGRLINSNIVVDHVSREIAKRIGGAQISQSRGIYINEAGKMIHEKNWIIECSFNDDCLPQITEIIIETSRLLFNHLNQESIAVNINGKLIIVSRNSLPEAIKHILTNKLLNPKAIPPAGFNCRIGKKWYYRN